MNACNQTSNTVAQQNRNTLDKQLSHIDVLPKTEKVIKRILNSEIKNI